jgi:hypothetical protein
VALNAAATPTLVLWGMRDATAESEEMLRRLVPPLAPAGTQVRRCRVISASGDQDFINI